MNVNVQAENNDVKGATWVVGQPLKGEYGWVGQIGKQTRVRVAVEDTEGRFPLTPR